MQWQVVSVLCWLTVFTLCSCLHAKLDSCRCWDFGCIISLWTDFYSISVMTFYHPMRFFFYLLPQIPNMRQNRLIKHWTWFCSTLIFWAEKNKILGPSNPILKTRRRQGEFHLLVKELQIITVQVCFRMPVVQVDTLLATLEPHVKRKTTNFCKLVDP